MNRVRSALVTAWASLFLLDPATTTASSSERTTEAGREASTVQEASWLARAQQHIREREYWASPSRDGLQAPNRAHNLRTYFGPEGARVHERTAADSPPLVEIRLQAIGRTEALEPVGPGEVTSEANRVEIQRDGLVEWYLNSPEGLEQGFTLEEKPPGDANLHLAIAFPGAEIALRGDSVVLETAARRLRYGKLEVRDATGRVVPSRFAPAGSASVHLVVEDADAIYPVTVDPLLSATADSQLESDQSGANMAWSVAGAGDVNGDGLSDILVGAPFFDAGELFEGAAFVFHGSPGGIGDRTPGLADAQLESDQSGANMAWSVAGAGDVNGDGFDDVIVGAYLYDAGESNEGAAFVFHGSSSGIGDRTPATADAQLESDQAEGLMGSSVASAGDVDGDGFADVIVGARGFDAGESNEGAAFVFHGSSSGIGDHTPVTADAQLEPNQADAFHGRERRWSGRRRRRRLRRTWSSVPTPTTPERTTKGSRSSSTGVPAGSVTARLQRPTRSSSPTKRMHGWASALQGPETSTETATRTSSSVLFSSMAASSTKGPPSSFTGAQAGSATAPLPPPTRE